MKAKQCSPHSQERGWSDAHPEAQPMTQVSRSPTAPSNASCEQLGVATVVVVVVGMVVVVAVSIELEVAQDERPATKVAMRRTRKIFTSPTWHIPSFLSGFRSGTLKWMETKYVHCMLAVILKHPFFRLQRQYSLRLLPVAP